MTSRDTTGGEIAIRLNHYDTTAERDHAVAAIGDLVAQHPFRLAAGWSPNGIHIDLDIDLIGPTDQDGVRDTARVLLTAALELFSQAAHVERDILHHRFDHIIHDAFALDDEPAHHQDDLR